MQQINKHLNILTQKSKHVDTYGKVKEENYREREKYLQQKLNLDDLHRNIISMKNLPVYLTNRILPHIKVTLSKQPDYV